MEILLLDAAVFKSDFRFEGGSQAEDDAAFHLRFDNVRIDDASAIDGAHDAMHPHCAVLLHGCLDDLGNIAVK